MQEVSRAHSSDAVVSRRRNPRLRAPLTKEQIQVEPLHPQYVAGFIDGEGSFVVGFGRHRTPLQAKKREVYRIFREIVLMFRRKEHLTDAGFRRIQKLRAEYRKYGKKHLKTARVRENRSPGGVWLENTRP